MMIDTPRARLPLCPGQMVRLQVAPQTRFVGLSGQAWITLDDDVRDIVLGPGDEFVADSAGRALVCALRGGDRAELWVSA